MSRDWSIPRWLVVMCRVFLLIFCARVLMGACCDCDDMVNGIAIFAGLGSPEDATLRRIAEDYAEQEGIKEPLMEFFDGSIDDFMEFLDGILDEHEHLDGLFIYNDHIDTLVDEGWLKPYPEYIDESVFEPEAIEAVKRDGTLYGIPLFMKDVEGVKRVKCVAVSTYIEHELFETTLDINEFISSPENIEEIVAAVPGGISVITEIEREPQLFGASRGLLGGSTEDDAILDLARSFAETKGIEEASMTFFNGPVNLFIEDVEEETLDFLIVFDEDIDLLIEDEWIQPYPEEIDEGAFRDEAIEAMKRDDVLYAIPLFIAKAGEVKGIAVSSSVRNELIDVTLELGSFLSELENSEAIAEAAGGIPARIR